MPPIPAPMIPTVAFAIDVSSLLPADAGHVPRQLSPISPLMTCSSPISGMRKIIFGLSTVVSNKRRGAAGGERVAHGELDLALRRDADGLQEFADTHVEAVFVHRCLRAGRRMQRASYLFGSAGGARCAQARRRG